MIDKFSGIDTEGVHYGFCHRRHAVIKSPILHNTRDGSEFYVPYISHYRGRTWALGKVGRGRKRIPGLHACLFRGVIPGGAGRAVAPQLLANNTFFPGFSHTTYKRYHQKGVNGFFYVSHNYMVMSDKTAIFQLKSQ